MFLCTYMFRQMWNRLRSWICYTDQGTRKTGTVQEWISTEMLVQSPSLLKLCKVVTIQGWS